MPPQIRQSQFQLVMLRRRIILCQSRIFKFEIRNSKRKKFDRTRLRGRIKDKRSDVERDSELVQTIQCQWMTRDNGMFECELLRRDRDQYGVLTRVDVNVNFSQMGA